MKRASRLILVGILSTLGVLWMAFGTAAQSSDIELQANVTALNNSGVTGTATVEISDEGLRGVLEASNLVAGHGYTVWFFYLEGTSVGGPGRFDSNAAAESGEVTFRGHVGGLRVSSGAKIRLLIFDHPDLTALPASGCAAGAATNAARANNLLTPQCGSPVGKAEFTIP